MLFNITKQTKNRANQADNKRSAVKRSRQIFLKLSCELMIFPPSLFFFFLPNCHNPNCSKEMNDVVGSNAYLLNGH